MTTFLFSLIALSVFANGGDQRVVENKYLINLSRSPFTPRIDVETSFLASFVNIAKEKLVGEALIVKIRIAKLGGSDKREFLFEQKDIKVNGGVLDFPYTFNDAGLHEIFFDFALASNPQKVYEAPDFLIDVQAAGQQIIFNRFIVLAVGIILGLIMGWLVSRRRTAR